MGITASIDISAEQRRLVLDLIQQHLPKTAIWAFGSRVKWTTRSNSDLDLVAFATPQQDPQVSALKEAFEESNLPFRVDLLVWDKLPENFQRNIQEGYVVLLEGKDLERGMNSDFVIHPYPKHWVLTTLGQICSEGGGGIQTGPFGSQLHAADYVDVGIPSIMPKNISIEEISTEDIAYISEIDAQRLSKYLVKKGDIVYSRRGDVEKCSLVTAKEDGWLCGTGCLRVRLGGQSEISPIFIHAYLSQPTIREWISRHAIGATMPNLNTSILSEVPVLIPSTSEREVIENIWHSTTTKITLNRQTNQTLEQIAQAIFKSWFVDFEPVKAKVAALSSLSPWERAGVRGQELAEQAAICAISGKTPKQLAQLDPQTLQQLKTTAALFPDALVDSELGEIPEGWEVSGLGVFIKFENGKSIQPTDEGKIPIYGANGIIGKTETPKFSNAVIIGRVGAYCGAVVYSLNDFWASDNTIVASPLSNNGMLPYIFYQLQFLNLNQYAGGAAQPLLNQTTLKAIEVALSPDNIISEFNRLVRDLLEASTLNTNQNHTLSLIRDNLLPKLLSGELKFYQVT